MIRFLILLLLTVQICDGALSPAQSFRNVVTAAAGGGAYNPGTVDYSGTAGEMWLERDAAVFTAAGNTFYLSVWLKPDTAGAGSADNIFHTSSDGVTVFLSSGDFFIVQCLDAANQMLVNARSTATITRNSTAWTHLFVKIDRTVDNQVEIYVNGTLSTTITTFQFSPTEDADPISLDEGDVAVGAEVGGGILYAGCMAELWVGTGHTYANITVGDFISGGDPVDLGATGTGPDGTQPRVYLRGDGTGWNVNSGAAGNFVKKGTTAFTSCSDDP